MSSQLGKHKDFLILLLTTDIIQARALLDTATKKQISVLSEIALNLLLIKHSKKIQDQMKKHNHILKKLSDKKNSVTKKRNIVSKYRKQLIKLLHLFKNQLLQML